MKTRGQVWTSLARGLDKPETALAGAPRPAPILPPNIGLKRLSVTQIKTLILDPYQIYARAILDLKKIPPLGQTADALVAWHDPASMYGGFYQNHAKWSA